VGLAGTQCFIFETKGFIMALQEQTVSTDLIKCSTYYISCQFLPVADCATTIMNSLIIYSACSCTFLVQIQNKQHHDKVAAFIHRHVASDAECNNWWDHSADINNILLSGLFCISLTKCQISRDNTQRCYHNWYYHTFNSP